MLKTILILLCSLSILIAQDKLSPISFVGEWELIGVSAQNKEIPELKGVVTIYLYKNQNYILKTSVEGSLALHKGSWRIDSLEKALLHLETNDHHFKWEVHALDQQTMVIEDLKDEAHISFRKKILANSTADSKKLEGTWFLAEAAGKTFSSTGSQTPYISLKPEYTIEAKSLESFTKGQWELSSDGKFFIVKDSIHTQVFEILYHYNNDFILRNHEEVFFFKRNLAVNEGSKGLEKRLIGTWIADNPPLPILKAVLLFQKDGTMNGVSNLNSSLRKWKLNENGTILTLSPYIEDSKEEAYQIRLYAIDKKTMILSDDGMTVVFKKQ